MILKKAAWPLLPVLAAMLAFPAHGEELLPFDDYEPPPGLFDDGPISADQPAGFLTAIEPREQIEKAPDPVPAPPKKPKAPNKLVKKDKPNIDRVIATVPKPPKPKMPPKPIVRSKTQLEDGQRLANPTVQDILADIEGVESAKSSGGKVTLAFMPGQTTLNLDMKNILLKDYVPKLKQDRESHVEIHAFASADEAGELGARRLSLARALEARDFLTAAGVESARINVMPLGNQTDSSSSDRVDLLIKSGKTD